MAAPDLPAVIFTKKSVTRFIDQKYPPSVYWIYNGSELVYFGASYGLRSRLLEHVRSGKVATHIYIESFRSTTAMARREKQEQEKLALTMGATADVCGVVRRNAAWKSRRV